MLPCIQDNLGNALGLELAREQARQVNEGWGMLLSDALRHIQNGGKLGPLLTMRKERVV